MREALSRLRLVIRRLMTAVAMSLPTIAIGAELSQLPSHVGDIYEITRLSESSQTGSGSSGSSHDKDTLIERVLSMREDGLELEYDIPHDSTAQGRTNNWQFPVRVSKPIRGQMVLLNRAELETRVDSWLKNFKLPRTACGHWIFTWNAFRIECDPQSIIRTLEAFDLRPADIRDGAMYRDSMALAPAPIAKKPVGSDGSSLVVELAVDPVAVLRERAQSDVIVAEISGQALTLDAAIQARSAEEISGTITIEFDIDSLGQVWRRTKLTKLQVRSANGKSETQTTTETVERRLVHG